MARTRSTAAASAPGAPKASKFPPHYPNPDQVSAVHAVEPSTKHKGKTLLTVSYMGNPSYQFLCDDSDVDAFRKAVPFNP